MKTTYIVRWVAADGHASGEERFRDADTAETVAGLRERRGHTVELLTQTDWADIAVLVLIACNSGIAVLLLLWLTR